ncbi:hypothetical protein OCU04_000178 [Sclerotinia nivalis]|uniref:Cytochrome P450 n=2 Tax=Sclerotinia nivalis TaxID=352851 RepID=A0A9X0AVQ3_9HELO|nr:hypothetical protein OCU04_000178 [Sclerotinia nivalis]
MFLGFLVWALMLSLSFLWLLTRIYSRWHSSAFPTVRRQWKHVVRWSNPISELVDYGYQIISKAQGKPFRMNYWGQEYTVLPPKYLNDIKRAERHHLRFFESVKDVFFLKYWIGDLFDSDRMVYTVKKGLNPHLPEATSLCIDEARHAFEEEFGDCETYKFVPTFTALCNIAHRIASKIIVGEELSRDTAFCKASYSYFQGHGLTGGLLLTLPLGLFRDLLAGPFSYYQRVRQRKVIDIVSAKIAARIDDIEQNKDRTPRIDCIEWTLKMLRDFPIEKTKGGSLPLWRMSHELVHLLGASHTPTGIAVTQMVWKMLAYPEYLDPLRQEADAAIAKFGFSHKIVDFLPLQDSFIRETNRLHPNNELGIQRVVCGSPFTFYDGLTLPVGTRVAFPISSYLRDPAIFPQPDVFDGRRYLNLAQADARNEDGVNKWAASHAHAANPAYVAYLGWEVMCALVASLLSA